MNIIKCPGCNDDIIISKINCKIFIHGYRKDTMKQVGPHSKLKYIESLKNKNNLLGCGCKFNYNGKDIKLYNKDEFNNY